MRLALIALLLLTGCGHDPTGPDPEPQSITVAGTLTDTVSGAILGSFAQTVPSLPALVQVSAAGHLPRTARISAASPTVDLIPEAGFDLAFYRQLARNGLEAPTALEPLRLLSASPSIYMQTAGLKPATVAAYEAAGRAVISALTDGRLTVVAWETGENARSPQSGRIVIDLVNDAEACGRALVGAAAGHVWINTADKCHRNGDIVGTSNVIAHELGHALGFYHVTAADALMQAVTITGTPSEAERFHAGIAYARSAGNRDVDQDQLTSGLTTAVMSVD